MLALYFNVLHECSSGIVINSDDKLQFLTPSSAQYSSSSPAAPETPTQPTTTPDSASFTRTPF